MSEFIESLASNSLFVITVSLISILGVVFTFIFYFKSRKAKKPKYSLKSNNILQNYASKIDNLEFTYNGDKIPNLTVTKLAFWNNGKETIHNTDIASTDEIIIKIKDNCKILNVSVLYEKNKANLINVELSEDRTYFKLTFEYLDYLEGCVIQFFHTGNYSEDIDICGTIKGYGIIHDKANKYNKYTKYTKHISLIAKLVFSIIFITFALLTLWALYKSSEALKFFSAIIIFFIFKFVVYKAQINIPKGFDVFEENF